MRPALATFYINSLFVFLGAAAMLQNKCTINIIPFRDIVIIYIDNTKQLLPIKSKARALPSSTIARMSFHEAHRSLYRFADFLGAGKKK